MKKFFGNFLLLFAVSLALRASAQNIPTSSSHSFDLAIVSISAPTEVACYDFVPVRVVVQNVGTEPARNFFVELYADRSLVDTKRYGDTLQPEDETEFDFKYMMSPLQATPLEFYATIAWFDDENPENDTSNTIRVVSIQSELPAPADLHGEIEGYVAVLGWQAPDMGSLALNPDFQVTGYNVYRQDVRINEMPVTDCSYTDETINGNMLYDYFVTALFANGQESAHSNIIVIDTASVGALHADDVLYDVLTLDGVIVKAGCKQKDIKNLLSPGVYVLRGCKMTKLIRVG